MAKPENIILVRHGQSEGNINHDVYADTPDYTVRLTPLGRERAATTGKELAALLEKVKTKAPEIYRHILGIIKAVIK